MTWPKQKTAHTGKPVRNSQRQAGAELTPASRRETYTGKPAKAPQTTQGVEPGVFLRKARLQHVGGQLAIWLFEGCEPLHTTNNSRC
jgi:hypothetical protein